jgi:hypothetical protein
MVAVFFATEYNLYIKYYKMTPFETAKSKSN